MKRCISLFLSLALVLTLAPAVFAANSPPYSLPYTTGIAGIRYVNYSETENLVSENFTVSQRTIEVYDVLELWLAQNGSWSATVQPFRDTFIAAGFEEKAALDDYGGDEYQYAQADSANNIDLFIIKSQKAAQAIFNDSATILIEHDYMIPSVPQNAPQKPAGQVSPDAGHAAAARQAADALYKMGLFSGTGTDADGKPVYDLDRAPTRHEAITMLVRLLGKTNEAESGIWNIPFTDVANWAKPYVGYAYANGLASGTSAAAFSGDDYVSAAQYITLVLRALGYESGVDFQWDKAWELSDMIGLTHGEYHANTTGFTRGDAAIISYNSLSAERKTSNTPLPEAPDIAPPQSVTEQPSDVSNGVSQMGSLVFEEIHCDRGGKARVGLKDAEAGKWTACCSDVLITDSDKSDCFIYVMSDASTRMHHYIECTDTNGYKYICMVVVF